MLYLDPVELLLHGTQAAFSILIVAFQLGLQTLNPALQQRVDVAGRPRTGNIFCTADRGCSVDQSWQRVWVPAS